MKVGILTFHASFNYGSMLQTWAMQKSLQSAGHQAVVLNYRTAVQKRLYAHPFSIKSGRDVLSFVYRSLKFGKIYWDKRHRWELFNRFLNDNLAIGKECSTGGELSHNYTDIEALICGSDQIWNPMTLDFSPVYFGNFHDKSKIKIGYAPSLGQEPEKLDKRIFENLITDFNALAVRERRSSDFLRSSGLYDNAEVVCDPTLLLDGSDYKSLVEDKPLIEGDYLYYYAPSHQPSHMAIAEEEAERMGLKLVCDTGYMTIAHKKGNIEYVKAAGPKEFLNFIKNAVYVSASSYHAIVFSILFHKDFTAINGDVDSRKMSLLNALGITTRNASITDKGIRPDYGSINWNEVEANLKQLRHNSLEFLKKSLDGNND